MAVEPLARGVDGAGAGEDGLDLVGDPTRLAEHLLGRVRLGHVLHTWHRGPCPCRHDNHTVRR